jgi:hypothetical protein
MKLSTREFVTKISNDSYERNVIYKMCFEHILYLCRPEIWFWGKIKMLYRAYTIVWVRKLNWIIYLNDNKGEEVI